MMSFNTNRNLYVLISTTDNLTFQRTQHYKDTKTFSNFQIFFYFFNPKTDMVSIH
jgi:hypothetical protein